MEARWLLRGALAGVAVGGLAVALPAQQGVALVAGLLWLTVGIYVGLAVPQGPRHVLLQAAGGAPVALLLLASGRWPLLLAAAWSVHPAWDLLHLGRAAVTRVPGWLAPFCLTFDVAMAAAAALVRAW